MAVLKIRQENNTWALVQDPTAIKYTVAQPLTPDQQAQARRNLGLFSSSEDGAEVADIKVAEAEEADHAETADAAVLAATAETAGQAEKLTCGDVGSTTQPVYFDDGVPVAIGNSLGTAAYQADTYFATASSLNTLNTKLTTFLGTNSETLSQVKALITAAEESTEIAALVTKIDALIERVAALEAKDHSVSYGTGAPSGGSVGDVYIRI